MLATARPPRGALLLCLALALTACRDTTAPAASIVVTVNLVARDGPSFSAGPDSTPRIGCTFHLRASATGSGRATWGDATLLFFAGKDRSTPIDSSVVPAAAVQSAWGKPDIGAGETEESGAQFEASIPFGAGVRYRYSPPVGGIGTAVVTFSCGPTATPTTPPPEITVFALQPVSGPVQPGDILKFNLAATSSLGLWKTVITLSGPCTARWMFADQLQQSVTRVANIPVPLACRLGVALSFTATTFDAAAQAVSRGITPGISLVDVTPPTVQALLFPPRGNGSASEHLAGDYFDGDSIAFIYIASDNYALGAMLWEVTPAGYRDSLIVSGRSAAPWLKVPVRPTWVGPIQLRLFARDSVGNTSDTLVSPPDSLRVYATIARPTVSASVDGEIRDVAIDQRRGLLYLAQGNQQRIAVLAPATMALGATLALPAVPTDLDLTAGGDSLLVTLPSKRALGVIDLRQAPLGVSLLPLTVLDTVTLDQRPWHVRVAANGKALISLEGSMPSAWTLMEVDLRTGGQRLRTDAGNGGNVGGGLIERSQDHSYLVLQGGPGLFQSYDAGTDQFGPRSSAIPYDWRPAIDVTGQHVAISVDIYDRALQFVRSVHSVVPPGVVSTAFSADGLILYQGVGLEIVRSRVSDGSMLDRSLTPVHGGLLRISPDGTMLVIVDSNCCATSRIAVMNLR